MTPEEEGDAKVWAALKAKGWKFFQYDPDNFQWMKFNSDGEQIATQGDDTWIADLTEAQDDNKD